MALREDAGHLECLCADVGHIAHEEDEDWLNDHHSMRKFGNEARQEAPADADGSATQSYRYKGSQTGEGVNSTQTFGSHTDEGIDHVVQDL